MSYFFTPFYRDIEAILHYSPLATRGRGNQNKVNPYTYMQSVENFRRCSPREQIFKVLLIFWTTNPYTLRGIGWTKRDLDRISVFMAPWELGDTQPQIFGGLHCVRTICKQECETSSNPACITAYSRVVAARKPECLLTYHYRALDSTFIKAKLRGPHFIARACSLVLGVGERAAGPCFFQSFFAEPLRAGQ